MLAALGVPLVLPAGCSMLFQMPREMTSPWPVAVQPDGDPIPSAEWSPELIDRLLDRRAANPAQSPSFDLVIEAAGQPSTIFSEDPAAASPPAIVAAALDEAARSRARCEVLAVAAAFEGEPARRNAIGSRIETLDERAGLIDALGRVASRTVSESLQSRRQLVAELEDPSTIELPPPPRTTPVFESYEFLDKAGPAPLTTPLLEHWRALIGGLDTNELYRAYDQMTRAEILESFDRFSKTIRRSIERRKWDGILSAQSRNDARWQERILFRVERVHGTYFRHHADVALGPLEDAGEIDALRAELLALVHMPSDETDSTVVTDLLGVDRSRRSSLGPAIGALVRGEIVRGDRIVVEESSSAGGDSAVSWVLCVASLASARWDSAANHLRDSVAIGLDAERRETAQRMIERRLAADPLVPDSAEESAPGAGSDKDPRVRRLVEAYRRAVDVRRLVLRSEFVVEDPDRMIAAWGEIPSEADLSRPVLRGLIDGECWVIPLRDPDGEIRFEWTADVAARVDPQLHALAYEAWRRARSENHEQLAAVSATLSWMARDRMFVGDRSIDRAESFGRALERELVAAPTSLTLWLAAFSFQPVGGPIDLAISDGVATHWGVATARRFGETAWPVAALAAEAARGFAR